METIETIAEHLLVATIGGAAAARQPTAAYIPGIGRLSGEDMKAVNNGDSSSHASDGLHASPAAHRSVVSKAVRLERRKSVGAALE